MAEPNVNRASGPTTRNAEASARSSSGASRPDPGEPIDAELEAELQKAAGEAQRQEIPLRRQWDSEMEAELEAALAGFDPNSVSAAPPRGPKTVRPAAARDERGQEARPGPRTGKVISIRGKAIFVDLGGKSEGILPADQFPEGELPAPGSSIEVVVDRFDPEEGVQLLRLKGAAIEANWENLRKGVVVEARVTKAIKGGAEVDVDGIRGFLPISQIDLVRVEDVSAYLNQRFKAIVTEANPRERNLVISRRDWLEQERAEQRERTWTTLEEGQVHEGVVRSIKGFGAFVDLGGVDGLLPIGEMSWSRIAKVDDLLKTGDKVTVKVLKIDRVTRKLTLGLKQLTPSPWERAAETYPRGVLFPGKVTRIMEFGAFVELEPGVEGLIHISELSPTRVRRVGDILKPGQEVEVRVLKVEPEVKRIALSLLPDPRKAPAAEEPEDEAEGESPAEGETPAPPKPERKIPLKGGLGDRERRN
jgi:small subunit ribosomal protein S1